MATYARQTSLATAALRRRGPAFGAGLWIFVAGLAGAITAAVAVVEGRALVLAAALVGLLVLVAVVKWPEVVLMVWFVGILADGRWLTYHKLGPLYITEPLLALVVLGLALRFAARGSESRGLVERRLAVRPLIALLVVMWLPALVGLLTQTSTYDYIAARNFVLILYSLLAVIAVAVTDLEHSYRRWFAVAVGGSAIALLIVVTGHAGSGAATSTGALRIAAHTFALAFGIAPIVLIAAAREGLIRPMLATAAAVPFLVALILVNHRSAWLAFLAAAVILFGRRFSARVVVGAVAVLAAGFALFAYSNNNHTRIGSEVTRARTVFSTTDPNAQFRLSFWGVAMRGSLHSPVYGAGFDPYPEDVVPPETVASDPFPAPHNSFVAIAYRIGFIPFVLVLFILASLIVKGFKASVERSTPRARALCSGLTAIVVYAGVTSAFNVFLEAPYAGPLFWTSVGLLAYAVYARPLDVAEPDEAAGTASSTA